MRAGRLCSSVDGGGEGRAEVAESLAAGGWGLGVGDCGLSQ